MKTKIDIILLDKNLYKLILKPVNNNYSDFLAILIRKLLFNLSKGVTITEIKIFNLLHEYDNIFGVKEDLLNIISNFKELIIEFKKKKTKNLSINIKKIGPYVIKGKDIINKDVNVLNQNKIIATLSENSKINLMVKLEKNCGFIPFASKNIKKKKAFDGIILDAFFCPIISIFYYINNFNNYDCINFFIKTNGTVNIKYELYKNINKFIKELLDISFKKYIYKKKINNFFFNYIKNNKLYNNLKYNYYYFDILFIKKFNFNKKFLNKYKTNLKNKKFFIKIFINYIKLYES